MTAEVFDLVYESHRSKLESREVEGGRLAIVPTDPPEGDGWRIWAVETMEDGTEFARFERRTHKRRADVKAG